MPLQTKTVETKHAPIRYLEGGSGEPLVFLHGAGGVTPEDPLLAELSTRFHVYAPFLPGYATCSTSRCTPGMSSRRCP
jgi:pimeloyl-ACP methyl ester carboxylesterase